MISDIKGVGEDRGVVYLSAGRHRRGGINRRAASEFASTDSDRERCAPESDRSTRTGRRSGKPEISPSPA